MDDNSNSRSSTDSVEVNARMDNSPLLHNGHMDTDPYSDDGNFDNGGPFVEILEQPQQRGFRFRYECEGPSHGGLQGSKSERYRKTVPTIKIRNYNGPARVTVELVTDESVPKAHAHKLVGKNCIDGKCIVEVKPGTTQIAFPNLCIQHVTKRKSAEVLEQRICETQILNKQIMNNDFSLHVELNGEEKQRAKLQANQQAKNMALNVVRLCFQAVLLTPEGYKPLPSKISDPIFDSKAPGANALKICRMDKYSGCCTGNDEVFLLCEKVQKDDIMVRFVEQNAEGDILWEAYGHFGPFDVHRQFAIVFKTPEYRDTNINNPVNVLVMLQRKSDLETSDPKSFTYYPPSIDVEGIKRKRQKAFPQYNPGSGGNRGNGNTDLKFGGGDSNSSNGSAYNGSSMQNGGSIPDFNNLKTNAFGNRISVGPRHRSGGHGDRNVIHAKRQLPSPNYQQQPAMFPADFLESKNYVYEEISKMSPPSQPLDASPQQLYSPTSPMNSSYSATSPYNNPQMMNNEASQNMAASQTLGMSNGGMSPQHMHTGGASPQHMQVASPQSNLGSPINLVNTSQPNIMYAGQMVQVPADPNIPLNSDMQMHMPADLQMTSGSAMMNTNYSQPVQVSNLCSENLDADFMGSDFHQQQVLGLGVQYVDNGQMFSQPMKEMQHASLAAHQSFSQQTCGYQARGGSVPMQNDEILRDVMSVIGYDEVDSTLCTEHMPRMLPDMEPGMDVPPSKVGLDMPPGKQGLDMPSGKQGLDMPPSKPGLDMPPQGLDLPPSKPSMIDQVPLRGYTATVRKEYNRSPQVMPRKEAPTVQVKGVETSDHEAQTDMDPMMKLAMKTYEALQYYACSGDIRSLLKVQRFLMAIQDQDGDLPLHTALINMKYEVLQNILDVMKTLPDAYTRINAYNYHHQTPLHLAVITNQPGAVDLLIRAGADTRLVDRNGYTPAHLAILYNRMDCLKNLVKYLRKGASKSKPFPELNVRCYDGFTPAHLAAQLENLAAIKLLVHGKADINLPDGKSGRSPLHHSVETDDLSLAAYLILQATADVNVKRFDGNTALHIACGRGNVGMVALLMAGGADPSIENDDVLEVVEYIGADNARNESKETVSATSDEKDTDTVEQQEVQETEGQGQDEVQGQDEGQGDSEADVSDDSEEEQTSLKPKRGMLPADFADNNDKILRALNGEPYSSIQESEDEGTSEGSITHITDKLNSVTIESGFGSMGTKTSYGDMDKLDYRTRLSLSQLLDEADWSLLADKLDLRKLIDSPTANSSPTRQLLDYFEAGGGTMAKLLQALKDIHRDDCADLVHKSHTVEDKCGHKDPREDSGVAVSYNKSGSPSPVSVRKSPQTT